MCGLVNAFDLDALRQYDFDERLKVLERTVAKSVAEHDGAVGQLEGLRHDDTPLSLKRHHDARTTNAMQH
jgi:hypothetical protein